MPARLSLTPADHGRTLTWEEFEHADYQGGFGYEIIHGRLYVTPAPNFSHEVVRDWLIEHLRDYARQRPDIIRRAMAPARVFLPDTTEGVTAPEPDIACYATLPEGVPLTSIKWQDISPILVAEVLSEGQEDKDLDRNRRLYAQVPSIREYWVIDNRPGPDRPSLIVFRRKGQRWGPRITIPAGGTYDTGLLPGFSLTLDLSGL
jgi:Uma2 family endonuclease